MYAVDDMFQYCASKFLSPNFFWVTWQADEIDVIRWHSEERLLSLPSGVYFRVLWITWLCFALYMVFRHCNGIHRADSKLVPSQWETAWLCNDVSHWLGASLFMMASSNGNITALLILCAGNSLICAWINCWANNREAGDLRRHCSQYDVTVMISPVFSQSYTHTDIIWQARISFK